jgi:GT2 family glycosyltransferase
MRRDAPTMRIGAVVVHYRFWPELEATLAAITGQTRPPDELVVMDDRSDDGSVEALRKTHPELEVHVAPQNRGCVANFNAGMRLLLHRGVDAILLLTHETVMEPDCLELLAARLEEAPQVGEVGPILAFLSAPDTVFSAGGRLLPSTWRNPHEGMYEPLARWQSQTTAQVPWLDTACVLVRARALTDTGLLAERYFHYYDDVELGVRLRQAGWGVESVRAAVARQEPGLLAEYYRVRNRLGFLAATAPRRVLARETARHLFSAVTDARRGAAGRGLAVAQLRAVRDAATGRWGRAPEHYVGARRRDWATGGALHGPCERTWAVPSRRPRPALRPRAG